MNYGDLSTIKKILARNNNVALVFYDKTENTTQYRFEMLYSNTRFDIISRKDKLEPDVTMVENATDIDTIERVYNTILYLGNNKLNEFDAIYGKGDNKNE